MLKMQQKSVAGLLCLALAAHAYVPASPSNELAAGVGVTNDIQINWLPMGQVSYRNGLTRVLVNNADGKSIAGYRVRRSLFIIGCTAPDSPAGWQAC